MKDRLYTAYLNGRLYGKGNHDYMVELFRDYVSSCDMYGNDEMTFVVKRNDYSKSKGEDN